MAAGKPGLLAKAEAENTLAAWKNFLKTYPQGEFAFRAEKKTRPVGKESPWKMPSSSCC